MASETQWSTADLAIASYLHSVGVPLIEKKKEGSGFGFVFYFDDTRKECAEMAISFISSNVFLFDAYQKILKSIVFGWRYKGLAGSRGAYETPNFVDAAYLIYKGVPLVGFRRTHSTKREYVFYFGEDKDVCKDHRKEFTGSSFDWFCRSMKELKRGNGSIDRERCRNER